MRSCIVSGLKIALVCLPLAAQSAFATGNLDCAINDKQLSFELFAASVRQREAAQGQDEMRLRRGLACSSLNGRQAVVLRGG